MEQYQGSTRIQILTQHRRLTRLVREGKVVVKKETEEEDEV